MIRNYCKKHFLIGGFFFLMILGIAFLNPPENGESYYWILYNRAYACMFYIPLFFYGMIPVLSDFFFSEGIVRYGKREELVYCYAGRVFCFAVYYTTVFFIVSRIAASVYRTSILPERGVGFLFTEFFLQTAGWCFLGLVFMLLYLLIRHFAAVWGVCVVSISLITAVGETFPERSAVRYIVSPYHTLYQNVLMESNIVALKAFIAQVIFSVFVLLLIIRLFKKTDVLKRGDIE